MPRRSHQLGPADYAILGLLALEPRHGYELASHFARGGQLGLVCTLGAPRLYALLHALEELDYVQCEPSTTSGGPPRKVFHATPTGRAAFQRWLTEPVRRIRLVRQDFLLKLYFAQHLDPAGTTHLVEQQIEAFRALEAELQAAKAAATPASFAALVYSSRISLANATIAWLHEQQARSTASRLL